MSALPGHDLLVRDGIRTDATCSSFRVQLQEILPYMNEFKWDRRQVELRWHDAGLRQHRFEVPAQRAAVLLLDAEL